MARTVDDIKQEIGAKYIANESVQQKYSLDPNKSFAEQFSAISLESILFYVVAFGIWVLEKLFDQHTADVNSELLIKTPHTARWYRERILRFQYPNRTLITDTDKYDNTGLTDDDIAALEVVKFCAVTDKLSELQIKVAKGEAGAREPLSEEEVQGLKYYLSEVRDAGVDTKVVNRSADKFYGEIDVYYSPLAISPDDKPVESAVKEYLSNLPFDGAVSRTALVDVAQQVEGVKLVNIRMALVQRADNAPEDLGVQKIAESGYWVVENDEDLKVNYRIYTNTDIA
ncbi:MAG: hypothetical protein ACRCZB_07505 [Bacteroidales bacterium]